MREFALDVIYYWYKYIRYFKVWIYLCPYEESGKDIVYAWPLILKCVFQNTLIFFPYSAFFHLIATPCNLHVCTVHQYYQKTFLIVPTDAHYYKIIELLKQFKIIIFALTCFGSRRNHHQGAVLCLAKTTKLFFCHRRYRCSQYDGGISACCVGVRWTTIPTNTEKPFCSFG